MPAIRAPGGLFWKVFLACWSTAMLTGLGINRIAILFPSVIDLPPVPPSVEQSVLMPVLIGGLIAASVSTILAWTLSRPLRLLRLAFSDAASGHLELRVTPLIGGQRDEFAELGRDYDRMAQQLQSLLGAQRRLLHDVSHELRSPLARLQMAVGLLRKNPTSHIAALTRIDHEVERLDTLVGEVLTLARLESGNTNPDRHPVDVVALLAGVAEDAKFEAKANGRDLRLNLPQSSVVIDANGELLLRAFENVIRNAIKYSPPATEVEVEVACVSGRLEVRVRDHGPGLSPTALESIFRPFFRLEVDDTVDGFGLGLAIAKRAIEAHGGQIEARNAEPRGLVMVLVLPSCVPTMRDTRPS